MLLLLESGALVSAVCNLLKVVRIQLRGVGNQRFLYWLTRLSPSLTERAETDSQKQRALSSFFFFFFFLLFFLVFSARLFLSCIE